VLSLRRDIEAWERLAAEFIDSPAYIFLVDDSSSIPELHSACRTRSAFLRVMREPRAQIPALN